MSIKAIQAAVAYVLANMDICKHSQYEDFLEIFKRIEKEMKGVTNERVQFAYVMLDAELYINKGDLDSVREHMVGLMDACK
jgi:hypothetical protein